MEIKDRIIIITGGSSGIGLSAAEELSKKGGKIIITGRNSEKLKTVSEKYGFDAYVCDVSIENEVIGLYDRIIKKYGTIDILINNAGFGMMAPLEEIKVEDFNKVFATNVTGAMLMAREAAKIFKEKKAGTIINIASTAATKGFEKGTAYAASKFALRGMTECWRVELRKYNIRVILINPSEVQTDFAKAAGLGERPFSPTKLLAEDIAHAITASIEMNERGFITELTVFATNPS